MTKQLQKKQILEWQTCLYDNYYTTGNQPWNKPPSPSDGGVTAQHMYKLQRLVAIRKRDVGGTQTTNIKTKHKQSQHT